MLAPIHVLGKFPRVYVAKELQMLVEYFLSCVTFWNICAASHNLQFTSSTNFSIMPMILSGMLVWLLANERNASIILAYTFHVFQADYLLLSEKNEVVSDSVNDVKFSSTKGEIHEQQYIYDAHQSNLFSLGKFVHVSYD